MRANSRVVRARAYAHSESTSSAGTELHHTTLIATYCALLRHIAPYCALLRLVVPYCALLRLLRLIATYCALLRCMHAVLGRRAKPEATPPSPSAIAPRARARTCVHPAPPTLPAPHTGTCPPPPLPARAYAAPFASGSPPPYQSSAPERKNSRNKAKQGTMSTSRPAGVVPVGSPPPLAAAVPHIPVADRYPSRTRAYPTPGQMRPAAALDLHQRNKLESLRLIAQ